MSVGLLQQQVELKSVSVNTQSLTGVFGHPTCSPIHQDLSSPGEDEKGVVTRSKGSPGRKGCGIGSVRKMVTVRGFLPSQFSMATRDTSKDKRGHSVFLGRTLKRKGDWS